MGGIAVALGIGAVIAGGTAIAGADTDSTDSSSRGSATSSATSSASTGRSAPAPNRAARPDNTVRPAAAISPRRGSTVPEDLAAAVVDEPPVDVSSGAGSGDSGPAAQLAPPLQLASPAAAVPVAPAATAVTLPAPTLPAANPAADLAIAPDPEATVSTPYGTLGKWMINKEGEIADWIGQPYCGPGSSVGNCTIPPGKVMQEPINTVFVVKANSRWEAEVRMDFAIRAAGFGPSCCSSIGYKGIVGNETSPQFPRGGPLGMGILAPLPFGLGQTGLLGLTGIGPAYRDLPFFLANTHIRAFGGEPDGNGNYIFIASASKENLDSTGGGLLPTHGYESFDEARGELLNNMVKRSWITGASDQGLVDMQNMIPASDPDYTTGDHDGYAQVIALGSMFAASPARSIRLF